MGASYAVRGGSVNRAQGLFWQSAVGHDQGDAARALA
jgi:hypothetical protein